ncbi:hypothetical protein KSD_93140 [Ktedonobacter sp. SOSP1-85]|jgi:hypothetical protein|uniref:Uncharacterized protein n=2 Tax=Ktedonobacter TaxID=363276 RepID=D6U087_KTERA|nr:MULTISPECIES: hypothetical protein [Ktedonobacter]EFH82227.1 hypothetical protein Krac_3017 [Ktedonobacter racemifer DSM 44963]GHO59691.1 hypothetical protein KSB_81660 [Ktedonobacter robiniae]GHO69870.1 hypothetical protein KSC_087620 [Ktedonobacter sp. SOSP1-52]GHO81543.1 hypothetical protein KSD_93140 [Ktedonobacter sp. SOSP1-85]
MPTLEKFCEHDLVMWHYRQGQKNVPAPAVVIRQEADGVVIRVKVEGSVKQVVVAPEQLSHR